MSLAASDEVDSSSRDGSMQDTWFPWTFRRILALPGPPLAIGASAALLSLLLSAAWYNASGVWQGYRFEGIPIWLHAYGSFDLAYAVFLGFAPVALIYLVRGAHQDLSQLGPALGLAPGSLAELQREVLSVPARSLRAGTALGLTTTEGCGGDSTTDIPNHTFGHGRIDAFNAIRSYLINGQIPLVITD